MDWIERLKDDANAAILWLLAAIAGAAVWTVRTVLTDRARVDKLEESLRAIKTDMDGSMGNLRDDIRQLTGHLLGGRKE